MKALISNGTVVELSETGFPVAKPFFWVDAGEAQVGWSYDDGDLIAPAAELEVPKTQFSVLEFRDRFTLDEQMAIRQAQFTDMEVGLVYDAFISAQFIDVEDPRVGQGIDLYVSKGLLDPYRKQQLLEPELIE